MPTLRVLRTPQDCSVEKIDGILHEIIQSKFLNHLQITNHVPINDGNAEWFVNMEDFNYLYGFRIRYKNDKIIFSSAINTWSIWAEHFTSEELAKQIGCKIIEVDSVEDFNEEGELADPEKVKTFLSWLRKRSSEKPEKVAEFYLYEMKKLPPDLRKIEGKINIIL
jgi:hypothetical protein